MTTKPLFALGVVMGAVAVIMLFVSPADSLWVAFFFFSGALTAPPGKSGRGSTNDAANVALTVAFVGIALLFAFFLIPDSFWANVHFRIPKWAYGQMHFGPDVVPLWARIALTAAWSVLTFLRFRQRGKTREEAVV